MLFNRAYTFLQQVKQMCSIKKASLKNVFFLELLDIVLSLLWGLTILELLIGGNIDSCVHLSIHQMFEFLP